MLPSFDIEELRFDIDQLIDALGISEKSRTAATFLYSSAFLGQNIERISVEMNIPIAQVKQFADRATENGIWLEDGRVCANWAEEPMSFLLDLLCIEGMLMRSIDESNIIRSEN